MLGIIAGSAIGCPCAVSPVKPTSFARFSRLSACMDGTAMTADAGQGLREGPHDPAVTRDAVSRNAVTRDAVSCDAVLVPCTILALCLLGKGRRCAGDCRHGPSAMQPQLQRRNARHAWPCPGWGRLTAGKLRLRAGRLIPFARASCQAGRQIPRGLSWGSRHDRQAMQEER